MLEELFFPKFTRILGNRTNLSNFAKFKVNNDATTMSLSLFYVIFVNFETILNYVYMVAITLNKHLLPTFYFSYLQFVFVKK